MAFSTPPMVPPNTKINHQKCVRNCTTWSTPPMMHQRRSSRSHNRRPDVRVSKARTDTSFLLATPTRPRPTPTDLASGCDDLPAEHAHVPPTRQPGQAVRQPPRADHTPHRCRGAG